MAGQKAYYSTPYRSLLRRDEGLTWTNNNSCNHHIHSETTHLNVYTYGDTPITISIVCFTPTPHFWVKIIQNKHKFDAVSTLYSQISYIQLFV